MSERKPSVQTRVSPQTKDSIESYVEKSDVKTVSEGLRRLIIIGLCHENSEPEWLEPLTKRQSISEKIRAILGTQRYGIDVHCPECHWVGNPEYHRASSQGSEEDEQ